MIKGDVIRKIREIKGVSQDYIASELGISQSAYSKIEKNETNLTVDRLMSISKILDVSVEDIINFDDKYVFQQVSNSQIGSGNYYGQEPQNFKNMFSESINNLKDEIQNLRADKEKLLAIIEKLTNQK